LNPIPVDYLLYVGNDLESYASLPEAEGITTAFISTFDIFSHLSLAELACVAILSSFVPPSLSYFSVFLEEVGIIVVCFYLERAV
jgi:hypothetical protein